jgi:hypothetical protein
MMIGSGTPSNQSNAPLPKSMVFSSSLSRSWKTRGEVQSSSGI